MVYVIEEGSDIPLDSIGTFGMPEDKLNSGYCLGCVTHGSKPVTMVKELGFKNRFDHHPHDLLDDAIKDRCNAKRSLFFLSRFVDPHPSNRCRVVVLDCLLY